MRAAGPRLVDRYLSMMPSASLPGSVKIVEVGPCDGLQNEGQTVPASVKIELANRLSHAGSANIGAAAFVSPKWVPRMASSADVMAGIERRSGTIYSALVPNVKGFAALAAGVDEVVIFAAASEAFSIKNVNCSIAESIACFREVAQATLRTACACGVR